MAFDFPSSPTIGQVSNGYTWDGEKWTTPSASVGVVRYDAVQALTAPQQKQARQNIAADTGAFIVDRNGVDQTGITAQVNTKIQFNNEVKDANNWFDAVTNFRYTPQIAGTYLIAISLNSANGTSGETCQALIYKNGAAVKSGPYFATSPMPTFQSAIVAMLPMNGTTDYIEAFVYLPATKTTLVGNAAALYMNGFRVGD